jgi:hypothetical protein
MIMIMKGMRFNPHWDPNSGIQVCGLIELMYDISLLYKGNNFKCIEIGSHIGESANIISSFPFVKKLYCIDIYSNQLIEDRLKHKIIENKIEIICLSSEEFSKKVKNHSIDMIYIDGDHSYSSVLNDFFCWIRKIKFNGFICGHDYSDSHKEVKKAVNKFMTAYNLSIYKQYIDASFCIINK